MTEQSRIMDRWRAWGFLSGDRGTCADCKRDIRFDGRHWDHTGENRPRHIAHPKGFTVAGHRAPSLARP